MSKARHCRRPGSRPVEAKSSKECGVHECHNKHVFDKVGGSKRYSSYCQEHTCQAPRDEHTSFCSTPRDPANRYCYHHGKCHVQTCTEQATRAEKQPLPYVCPRHRCIYAQCFGQRYGNFQLCQAHLTCQYGHCSRRPQPSELQRGILLCRAHSCHMDPNCNLPADPPGAGHCRMHLPCGLVPGCRRPRMPFPNGGQAVHCDQHIPCDKSGQGCRQLAAPNYPYCTDHKCIIERCIHDKKGSSHFCKNHTCAISSCPQVKFDMSSRIAMYCFSHECAVDRCHNQARSTNGYCADHGCSYRSCNSLRSGSSSFCIEHCCRHDGCWYEAAYPNAFCRSHTCEEAGCKDACLGGPDHIRKCLTHWTRDARNEAISEVGQRYQRRRERLEERIRQLEQQAADRDARDRAARLRQQEILRRVQAAREAQIAAHRRGIAEQMQRQREEERVQAAVAAQREEDARRQEAERRQQEARDREEAEQNRRRQEREDGIAREAEARVRAAMQREQEERDRKADRRLQEMWRHQRELERLWRDGGGRGGWGGWQHVPRPSRWENYYSRRRWL